jgi:hypothetical protein
MDTLGTNALEDEPRHVEGESRHQNDVNDDKKIGQVVDRFDDESLDCGRRALDDSDSGCARPIEENEHHVDERQEQKPLHSTAKPGVHAEEQTTDVAYREIPRENPLSLASKATNAGPRPLVDLTVEGAGESMYQPPAARDD